MFFKTTYKSSVRTSQKAHYASSTKISLLILSKATVVTRCGLISNSTAELLTNCDVCLTLVIRKQCQTVNHRWLLSFIVLSGKLRLTEVEYGVTALTDARRKRQYRTWDNRWLKGVKEGYDGVGIAATLARNVYSLQDSEICEQQDPVHFYSKHVTFR